MLPAKAGTTNGLQPTMQILRRFELLLSTITVCDAKSWFARSPTVGWLEYAIEATDRELVRDCNHFGVPKHIACQIMQDAGG